MSQLLGTSVDDLVQTMRDRRVRIPSEIGAFIALEACEALIEGPAKARTKDVRISDDGTISIYAPPNSATSEEAARSVVALLSALLLAAGTGVPKGLVGLVERGPSSQRWDLASLKNDLEASLVPLNRAAARRVLSRLLREAKRPHSGRPAPAPAPVEEAPPDATLDAELDALMEPAPAEIPKAAPLPREVSPPALTMSGELDAELDATISELDVEPRQADESTLREAPAPMPAPRAPVLRPEDETPHAPLVRRGRSDAPTEPPPQRSTTSSGLEEVARDLEPRRSSVLPWLLAIVAVIAATAAGLALMRPDLIDRALGRPPAPAEDPGPTQADRDRMMHEHRARFGRLTVHVTQERAQVLLFIGHGPALAEELPMGVANEFVAIAEGRAPTRSVLPADAQWEHVEGGRSRYELAMQIGQTPMETLDLGPTQLPHDVGSPTGLGDVRVITNPPGAKVYVLVGFSPEVVVENVHTDEAVELLVYLEGHPVSRLVVGPSDWQQAADGSKSAEVSVTLEGDDEEPPLRRR